jgi:bifunctional enzyme CysN/CysC
MIDAGLIVLVNFISPFRRERRMARSLFAEGEFVDTPIEECEGLLCQGAQRATEELDGD